MLRLWKKSLLLRVAVVMAALYAGGLVFIAQTEFADIFGDRVNKVFLHPAFIWMALQAYAILLLPVYVLTRVYLWITKKPK